MAELYNVENSSNIKAIGYDPESLTATCVFKDKFGLPTATWEYTGMSQEVFDEWLAAESKGRFFQSRVKKTYPGRKVEG